MATIGTPKYTNDIGAEKIQIAVKEFECIGATAPFDHPHVYLDMGADTQIVCPYCSTLFEYNGDLGQGETIPAHCCVSVDKVDA